MCLNVTHWANDSDSAAIEPVYKRLVTSYWDYKRERCVNAIRTPTTHTAVPRHGFLLAGNGAAEYQLTTAGSQSPLWQTQLTDEVVHAYCAYHKPTGRFLCVRAYALGVVAWGARDHRDSLSRDEVGSLALYVPSRDKSARQEQRQQFFKSVLRSRVDGRLQRLLDSPLLPLEVCDVLATHLDYEW